eukprot:Skav214945  [mRNA]  locus=scaffold2244:116066:117264:- [translate_table: standard]
MRSAPGCRRNPYPTQDHRAWSQSGRSRAQGRWGDPQRRSPPSACRCGRSDHATMAQSSQRNWKTIHGLSQTTCLGEWGHLTSDEDQLVLLGDGGHGHRRAPTCHSAAHGNSRRSCLWRFSRNSSSSRLGISPGRAHVAGGIGRGSNLGSRHWLSADHVQDSSRSRSHGLRGQWAVGHGCHLRLSLGLSDWLGFGANTLGQS